MPIREAPKPERFTKAKDAAVADAKCGGQHHRSVIGHGDEPTIERRVEVRGEQEPVEYVEALTIAFAVGPRLDVAGSKKFQNSKARDRTAPFPIVDQTTSEDVLADTLDDDTLGLGGPREHCGLLHEGVQQLVGECLRQLERPSYEMMEGWNVSDASRSGRAGWERSSEGCSEVGKRSGYVLLREGCNEDLSVECRQPELQRSLRACKGKPVAYPHELLIEAVVDSSFLEARDCCRS